MAWYKPGRDPDHPGDPPPKWARLSRTARLALLITVIAGIVIALLVITTRTAGAIEKADAGTVGSGSSPTPRVAGQLVEVPEAGLALTFPSDWVIELDEEGSDLSILVLAHPDRFGPEVELQSLLVAESPYLEDRDTRTGCTLVRYAPIGFTADEFLLEIFGQSDSIVVERLSDGLSRVLVNQWFQSRILADDPEASYSDHYAIGGDGVVAVLWCTGSISHRGDWLSIAESVEFPPPMDPSAEPTGE